MTSLSKAKELLQKLDGGKNVSMRDFQNSISETAVAEYKILWESELELRRQFEEKPDKIKKYEQMLKAAAFENNKADGMRKLSSHNRIKLQNEAESLYERALEYLDEIINDDQNLRVWFDRDLEFSAGSNIGCDNVRVPRVVTSRSLDKQDCGAAKKRSKAEIKREVIENAIAKIETEARLLEEVRNKMAEEGDRLLKSKLAKLIAKR